MVTTGDGVNGTELPVDRDHDVRARSPRQHQPRPPITAYCRGALAAF
jgi:hypothetical protein